MSTLTEESSNFSKSSRNRVITGSPSKSLKWLFTHNNTILVTCKIPKNTSCNPLFTTKTTLRNRKTDAHAYWPCLWDCPLWTIPEVSCPLPWGWTGRCGTSGGSPRCKWDPPPTAPPPGAWSDVQGCPDTENTRAADREHACREEHFHAVARALLGSVTVLGRLLTNCSLLLITDSKMKIEICNLGYYF